MIDDERMIHEKEASGVVVFGLEILVIMRVCRRGTSPPLAARLHVNFLTFTHHGSFSLSGTVFLRVWRGLFFAGSAAMMCLCRSLL